VTADTELAVGVAKMGAVIGGVMIPAKTARALEDGGVQGKGPVEIADAGMNVGYHLGAKDSIA
jgi:hypothetical protein